MLRWLGHSCFLFETDQEAWLMDPFAPDVGYAIPQVNPTVVSLSHEHWDHADESWLPPACPRVRGGASWVGKDLTLRAVESFHDSQGGAQRGENHIYIGQTEDLTIVHLGDLGHLLSKEQIGEIGKVDILLLPIGGTYTIEPQEAWRTVMALAPAVIIPMHYQTEHLTFPLESLEKFLAEKPVGWTIEEKNCLPRKAELSRGRLVVLKYS